MTVDLSVRVTYELRDTEPSGEKCCMCGDECYLNEYAVFGIFENDIVKIGPTDLNRRLCGSCGDAVKESL